MYIAYTLPSISVRQDSWVLFRISSLRQQLFLYSLFESFTAVEISICCLVKNVLNLNIGITESRGLHILDEGPE